MGSESQGGNEVQGGWHWAKVTRQASGRGAGPRPLAELAGATSGWRGAGWGSLRGSPAPPGAEPACVGKLLARHTELFSASFL